MKLQLFLAAAALLVCGITAELIVPPGPLPLCSYYKVVPAPATLSEGDFFINNGNGFRPNLFLYNPASLMSGSPAGPWIRFVDGSWTPGGALDFSFKIYNDSSRTPSSWVGNGTGHSNMFATNPDFYPPDGYTISYVGGYVRFKTTMFAGYSDPSGPEKKNFRNFDETLYFLPDNSMPGAYYKPLMNRLLNKTEINFYQASKVTQYFSTNTMAANDLYVIMWGSNGWTGTQYAGYTTGADIVFKLVCAPAPPTPNGGPVPPEGPCPDGNCVNNFLANYPGCVSAPIVASNPTGNCVSLEFQAGTSNTPCPALQ